MLSWLRPFAELPPSSRPMARQLLADFQTIGLLSGVGRAAFAANLLAGIEPEILEELTERWAEARSPESPDAQQVRVRVAAWLAGVHSDWRFDPSDVLAQASARLPGRPALVGTREARGEVVVAGRRLRDFHVSVALADAPAVRWRCSSLVGFMDAVNHAVARAGLPGQFVALATDGDHYAYVHASDGVRERLVASALLPLSRERDPLSGPLAVEAA